MRFDVDNVDCVRKVSKFLVRYGTHIRMQREREFSFIMIKMLDCVVSAVVGKPLGSFAYLCNKAASFLPLCLLRENARVPSQFDFYDFWLSRHVLTVYIHSLILSYYLFVTLILVEPLFH